MNAGNGDVALPHHPTRIGQGTAIEQQRAAAEVYAAVLAAKQAPRDEQRAIRVMSDACGMDELAERAFFRFARGGSQVTGATVHLARELARCWGNIQYGVSELRRDDDHGQSEMQAFAWDMESNARAASIFIVPHRRDKRGGGEDLTDARDIYENNANAGARRVREAIFSVLPLWFVEKAQDLCRKTLTAGGGKPLQERIADVIDWFGRLGVTEEQLIAKVGRPTRSWTELDIAPLGVIYRSIRNGETTKEREFPAAGTAVTADQIISQGTARQSDSVAERSGSEGSAHTTRVDALFEDGGISNPDTRLTAASVLVGRDLVSWEDATDAEVTSLIATLERMAEGGDLAVAVAELIDRPTQNGGA